MKGREQGSGRGSSSRRVAERGAGGRLRIGKVLGALGVAALLVAEARRPLRKPVAPRAIRVPRNLLLAAGSALVVNWVEDPLARDLARSVDRRRAGLVPALGLPRWAETLLGFLLLDYTLYHWHRLTHRLPLLWRFHATHHADPDLDATTGFGFSPVEMLLSVPYRLAQVRLFGITPRAFAAWKGLLLPAILFHHSNLRLPRAFERILSYLVVTPRMHGIHHSDRPSEQNSNWSSMLAAWDRLHGSYRFDVPQSTIHIGLPQGSGPGGQPPLRLQRRGVRGPPAAGPARQG